MMNKVNGMRYGSWTGRGKPNGDHTPSARGRVASHNVRGGMFNNGGLLQPNSGIPTSPIKAKTPSPEKGVIVSPRKGSIRAGTTSPVPSRKEINISTPKSSI